jgi:predicted nuclease with RNAse H fold
MNAITCIGVDVTWWGGSRNSRASRRETIVAIRLDDEPSITIETIDLSLAPNPESADNEEPNFDRDGSHLVDALLETVDRITHKNDRVLIALDAPLESAQRPKQPARRKAVAKGVPMGSVRRECEKALSHYASMLPENVRKIWNGDLRIQSGSPIPPRITSLLARLQECGYEIVRNDKRQPMRGAIEIFPSEAIWALGTLGHYPDLTSKEVRAYKSKNDRVMSTEESLGIAARPFLGFSRILEGCDRIDSSIVASWIDELADHAVACSRHEGSDLVHKGKGFDDAIDSGIAALTCVAYALGQHHLFGNGTDGVIIGPGQLGRVAVPEAP